jgi:hypothetical protein
MDVLFHHFSRRQVNKKDPAAWFPPVGLPALCVAVETAAE